MNEKEKKLLLKLARSAIESSFKDEDPKITPFKNFTELYGCFVTLTIDGNLRGCIGFVKPIMPLYEQIITSARAAAFDDPRFSPLTLEEFKKTKIEISILTLPEIIKAQKKDEYIDFIKIGKHGLIVEYDSHSGVLLPQVAIENKFNSNQFLEAVCEKADLPKNSWTNKNAKIYYFEAEIFSESTENLKKN